MYISAEYIVVAGVAGGLYLGWRAFRRKAQALRTEINTATPGRQPTDADVMAQIHAGKNLVAAKLYMDVHKVGLREAVETVELLALSASGKAGSPPQKVPGQAVGDAAFMAQLMGFIQRDEMISAIKLYRERQDCDLRTAKAAVEALAQSRHVPSMEAPQANGAASLAEIVQLVQAGRKIEAIKRYREQYDCDLKTAKAAIDAIAEGRPV